MAIRATVHETKRATVHAAQFAAVTAANRRPVETADESPDFVAVAEAFGDSVESAFASAVLAAVVDAVTCTVDAVIVHLGAQHHVHCNGEGSGLPQDPRLRHRSPEQRARLSRVLRCVHRTCNNNNRNSYNSNLHAVLRERHCEREQRGAFFRSRRDRLHQEPGAF